MLVRFFLGPKNLIIRNIKKIQLGFSSEIKVPQLGSARAGNFRLGLITTTYWKNFQQNILHSKIVITIKKFTLIKIFFFLQAAREFWVLNTTASYRGSPPFAHFGTWKKPCYMKFLSVGLYCGPLLTHIHKPKTVVVESVLVIFV